VIQRRMHSNLHWLSDKHLRSAWIPQITTDHRRSENK